MASCFLAGSDGTDFVTWFIEGSAIFEVLGTYAGPRGTVAFRLDEHLKRLMKSAEFLGMEMAYSTETLVEAIKTTVRENRLGVD